jgi:predicted outer membrane repeat protein
MKNNVKRLLSGFLAGCMMTTLAPVAFASSGESSSDIEGHWAQTNLQEFIDKGWLTGYGNGQYGPNDSMTRAQYAALINRVTGLTEESETIADFTDVKSSDWYYSDLAKALAAGYMTGTSSDTMSPTATITREQSITMVARLLGLTATDEEVESLSRFSDASDISEYARNAVAAMSSAGYVNGNSDGSMMPKKQLSRAEGITVLHNAATPLSEVNTEVDKNEEVVSTNTLKDGVYTGTGAGYGGTIKLQMTVEGGKITKIDVLSQSETGSYFTRAKTIIDSVISKQTTDGVNAVSGATKSSNGLLTAINACISQAKGGEDTSKTGATGGGGGGGGNSTKTEGQEFTRGLKDGEYEGSATGYSGTTKVKVTVADGKITAVDIVSHGDTTSYFERAKSVITKVIDSQSTDVDTVSGATYSSYGILNAINNALEDAESSGAATIEVASWSELTKALAAAQDGDTIQLTADIENAGDTYEGEKADAVSSATLGMLTVSKAVTIDGSKKTETSSDTGTSGKARVSALAETTESTDCYTISAGENTAFCFNISGSGVTIKNLVIDGASYGFKMGGGIYLAGGHGSTATPSLDMDNVTVQNCSSYKATMPGNGGGAIYAKGNVTLTAKNCTFTGNVVNKGFGGAILAQGANVTLTDCKFSGNTSEYGGAIAANGTASLTVTGCDFTGGNDAKYGGNDIYIFDGMTPTKAGQYSDSAVTYNLSGNSYQDDSDATNANDYSVMIGRVLGTVEHTVISISEKDGKEEEIETKTVKTYSGSGNSVFIAEHGHDITYDIKSNVAHTKTGEDTFTDQHKSGGEESETEYVKLWMNIPYDDFYKAEVTNDVKVDAFTSATQKKTTGNLAAGSYHNEDGSEISGITFPVVMTNTEFESWNKDQTKAENKDDLFKNENYSYYKLSENDTMPYYYKVATYNNDGSLTFSKVNGASSSLSGVKASLTTETSYGDYELNLIGVDEDNFSSDDAVYGVVLHTKDHDYGLRHLENIWLATELAWCTGFTTSVHNCSTSSDHYKSIMGETINSITYYTSKGIYEIPVSVYIPVKFTNTLSVTDALASNRTTVFTATGFPEDYGKTYTVTNSSNEDVTSTYGFHVSENALTWTSVPPVGQYTLTVSDSNVKYASYSKTFVLSTSDNPVAYDNDTLSLKAASGYKDSDLEAYISAISSVTVAAISDEEGEVESKRTSYSATGKGATTVINSGGFIDLNAKSGNNYVFSDLAEDKEYSVTVKATGYTKDLTFKVTIPKTIYAYASLSYAEYWENEGIDVSGNNYTAAGTSKDSNNESDTGAFDAVSRATLQHGLHRGSFQQSVTIKTSSGTSGKKTYSPLYWKDGNNFVDSDGNTYNKTEIDITSYEITGIKYVPVAVAAENYRDLCKGYTVTQNGETLAGGFSEVNLNAYSKTAFVTANTNGLKAAKLENKTWSFEARQTGTDSGILGETLATAKNVTNEVVSSSKFGDFIRMDIKGDYGALGDMMQTVVWKYYGTDSTYTTAIATYGTKFAADNWMHKSMGIQLGLTESLRCQLPDNTDGTGYWTVTVYALGYSDYTAKIKVEQSDIHKSLPAMTDAQKTQLTSLKEEAGTLLTDYNENTESGNLKTLKEHYDEAVVLLEKENATSAEAEELITELTALIAAVTPSQPTAASEDDDDDASVDDLAAVLNDSASDAEQEETSEDVSDDEESEAEDTESADEGEEETVSADVE